MAEGQQATCPAPRACGLPVRGMPDLVTALPAAPPLGWIALNALLAALAVAIASWLRPWRCVGVQGPPWPWGMAWLAVLLLWAGLPLGGLLRPISGIALLVLMAGWPLAVLAMAAAALLAALSAAQPWAEALQRLVWIGIVPATCVLGIGAAVRRWLPLHLFAYILGRGYVGTLLASLVAGAVLWAAQPAAPGVSGSDLVVANLLLATGEAGMCGTLLAILVVLRPQWLATYAERLYRAP